MRNLYYRILRFIFSLFPLKKRKILFMSYYGAQYGCSPKYLSEYIAVAHPEWDIVWAFTDIYQRRMFSFRSVKYMSLRYFYELYTAKVFVTNYRMPAFFRRRRSQLYVQTWHSSLRLKAIEADAVDTLLDGYRQMAVKDSESISFITSGCHRSTEIFSHAFWFGGEILPTGTPRSDILFSRDSGLSERICTSIGLSPGVHTLLYAPTFRESKTQDVYDIDLERLCDALSMRFSGEWCVLLRLHPHLRGQVMRFSGGKYPLVDVTGYDDIQELLCVSEVLVSDYSSLIFDFALTGRPCFLYLPDLQEYIAKERRLYFTPSQLPFPVISDNQEISAVVGAFNDNAYKDAVGRFLASVGSYEDGHASERVYNEIMKRL